VLSNEWPLEIKSLLLLSLLLLYLRWVTVLIVRHIEPIIVVSIYHR